MGGLLAALRNRGLVALAFGHMTVDSYVGVLPVLYPLLIGRFHLDLGTIGLLSLAYTGMSSVSQPFFGLIADRWGTRFVGGALLWTAAWFAAIGFAPNFPVLIVAGGIAGLGSGFFHPLGALTVRGLLSERGTNSAMSLYVSGGTFGVAMGPLIGVLVFGLLAVQGTALLLLPGLVCSAFLLVWMRANRPGSLEGAAESKRQRSSGFVPIVPLAATVLMMMSRTWTTATLQAWVPTWYHQLGYPPWFYGGLASTIVLCSALGTIGCGTLADRFGRRTVVMVALWLSVPAVWLFVAFPGPQGFLTAALVGFLAASTSPLMLLMAQELLAARAGLASGLILGIGFMTGAVGVPITGNVGDRFGLQAALLLQVAVVAATIPIAFLLPTERYLRRLRQAGEGERHTTSTETEEVAAGP
ncbi:MAG: MFS transporter [Candidatus Dormibacteraeota bacterium]|nr:MFS transporter [Candidatus Dormibacteraeota bacterium]MBO0706267.1 MFS transporter [Candidatus Dormibacteraeota bacterium]MBO0762582.1 MFS transporter [Candidatus Dormibacteraeota bacterium]